MVSSMFLSLLVGCVAEEHLSLLQTRALSKTNHDGSQPAQLSESKFEFEEWSFGEERSCAIKLCGPEDGNNCKESHPVKKNGKKGSWGHLGTGVTLDECQEACLGVENGKCRYISYNTNSQSCTGWKWCTLKEDQKPKPHLKSFRKVLKEPRSMVVTAKRHVADHRRCSKNSRLGHWGELGQASLNVSEEQCMARCGRTEECMFASFDEHRGCNMYRNCDKPIMARDSSNKKVTTRVWTVAIPHMFLPCKKQTTTNMKTQCLTKSAYAMIVNDIRGQYNKLSEDCNDEVCPQASWAGCILRMAGHDFMDFKTETDAEGNVKLIGGSDGCTDMTDVDNGGLAECLIRGEFQQSIHISYNKFCGIVSLADFLVIAAEAVMQITREKAIEAVPEFVPMDFQGSFKFGRTTKDVQTCTFEKELLPNPEKSCPDVEKVFMTNMGLTAEESAALSAVHSLGRARKEVSGYDGWWSDPENSRRFNNDYFVSILAKGWKRKIMSNNPQKTQWVRQDKGGGPNSHEMMLNSDMCLMYGDARGDTLFAKDDEGGCCWVHTNLEDRLDNSPPGVTMKQVLNSGGKNMFCGVPQDCRFDEPGCAQDFGGEFGDCCVGGRDFDCGGSATNPKGGLAPTSVFRFAANDTAWAEVFLPTWNKATENGFQGLQSLQDNCPRVAAMDGFGFD